MNIVVEHDLRYASLLAAANATTKVGTLTHSFYRYPARFGETFVREAVLNFSREGDGVLDLGLDRDNMAHDEGPFS